MCLSALLAEGQGKQADLGAGWGKVDALLGWWATGAVRREWGAAPSPDSQSSGRTGMMEGDGTESSTPAFWGKPLQFGLQTAIVMAVSLYFIFLKVSASQVV